MNHHNVLAHATCTINGRIVPCPELSIVGAIAAVVLIAAVFVFVIVTMWKVFTKAGKPGWASIVPFYNIVVLLEIVKKPTWWVLLMLIPFVNIIVGIYVTFQFSKVFGRGTAFGFGLLLIPVVFYPILAFGKSTYHPELADDLTPPTPPSESASV